MTTSNSFPQTDRDQVKRVPNRGHYDKPNVHKLLDAAHFCHVGITIEGRPSVIPMIHARDGDTLYFHGSTKSRLMLAMASGNEICVTATMFDGLVLARSLFHHSMNYRSVVCFGTGKLIDSNDEKMHAFKVLTDGLIPGRWEDSRLPFEKEMKATAVVAVSIESASAKIRVGGPIDETDDYETDHWAGVVKFETVPTKIIPDEKLRTDIATPGYVNAILRKYSS